MPKNEKKFDTEEKKWENSRNYFHTMRRNVDRLMDEKDMKVKELADLSGLNMETVKSFLYDKDSKDCRLSTAIGIARAFGLTIAELAETKTIEERMIKNMNKYRNLPESAKSLIDWMVDYQKFIHEQHSDKKIISVMLPICNNTGNLKKTNDYEPINIENIGKELLHKIFMGIKIPCEHYLPHYLKGDILLIANDRDAMQGENSVIIINGNLMITRRVIEKGQVKYYGIRDGIFRSGDSDNVYVLGYIAHVIESKE